MLPISSGSITRFTPSSFEQGDEAAPVYLLKTPSLEARIRLQRELFAAGARLSSDQQVRDELRKGIKLLVEESQQAELFEIIAQVEEATAETAGAEELQQKYMDIFSQVEAQHRPLAEMVADRAVYQSLFNLWAVKMFLAGIENSSVKFEKNGLYVSEDTLKEIPSDHLVEIAGKLTLMMFLSKEQEKNLHSQLSSALAPETSTAVKKRRTAAAGKS